MKKLIDTIVFRIHNITDRYLNDGSENAHYHLATYLKKQTVNSLDSFTRLVNIEEWARIPNELQVDYFQKFDGASKTIMRRHANKLYIDSSHYFATYFINFMRDYIEFNFSIPKYLYGNNSAQFVENRFEKTYFSGLSDSFDYQAKHLYKRFLKFFKKFEIENFGGIKLNYDLVEMTRIDFCYNQIFQTKKDALEYLEFQKKIEKKRARKESNILRGSSFRTSLSYVTKKWSFKIYHKGSEYKSQKGDKKKHLYINKILSHQQFDVKRFQSLNDRILRYEITFRSGRMSDFFRNNLFRVNDQTYKIQKRRYRNVASITRSGSRFFWNIDKNGNKIRDAKKAVKFKEVVTKVDRNFYQDFKKHLQLSTSFFLTVPKKVEKHNSMDNNLPYKHYSSAKFSSSLFRLMLREFKSVIEEFRIDKKDTVSTWQDKIFLYNKSLQNKKDMLLYYSTGEAIPKNMLTRDEIILSNRHKMSSSRIKMIMNLLQYMTLDDMLKKGLIPKGTYKRYKSDLKKLNIDARNLSWNLTPLSISLNYDTYNLEVEKFIGILQENYYSTDILVKDAL